MLDRESSRRMLAEAEQNAYIVLNTTPDDPRYTMAADLLARQTLQLSEYLGQLDAQATKAGTDAREALRAARETSIATGRPLGGPF